MAHTKIDLANTYLWLNDTSSAIPVKNDEYFWRDMASGQLESHRHLITKCRLTQDFPHWEMHPEGDEIVTVLSGQTSLILLANQTEQHHPLSTGDTFVIPRKTWHRVTVKNEVTLLVITNCQNTEQRPIQQNDN